MSDTIVSVIDYPVNVSITNSPPPAITINTAGVQGVAGSGAANYLSGYATSGSLVTYVSGVSGYLQNEINNQIISNVVYTTGDQTISGNKTFNNGIFTTGIISSAQSNNFIDLNNQILSKDGSAVVQWGQSSLYVHSGNITYNWDLNYFYDKSGQYSLNYNDRQLLNIGNGSVSLDWNYKKLLDNNGSESLDWQSRILKDAIQNYSVQYSDRFLRNSAQDYVLDWNNRVLSGDWSAQNFFISGSPVVTQSQIFRAWNNLTWAPTTVWNVNQSAIEDRAILTLTGNTTLAISGLYNGWQGIIKCVQSNSGFSLTLPTGTKVINNGLGQVYLTTGISGAVDILSFSYDGTDLLTTYGNYFS